MPASNIHRRRCAGVPGRPPNSPITLRAKEYEVDILRSLLVCCSCCWLPLLSNNRRAVSGGPDRRAVRAAGDRCARCCSCRWAVRCWRAPRTASIACSTWAITASHSYSARRCRRPDVPVVRRRRVRVRPARAADDHLRDRTDRGAVLHRRDEVDRRDPRRWRNARREPSRRARRWRRSFSGKAKCPRS